jgi:hypothetical protein
MHHEQRRSLENALRSHGLDFSGAYLTLRGLHDLVEQRPADVNGDTLRSLECVLNDQKFTTQTQAFFLYREAAEVLVTVMEGNADDGLGEKAFSALRTTLAKTDGPRQRATTEALGSLPLCIHGPTPHSTNHGTNKVAWEEMTACVSWAASATPTMAGRNIIFISPGDKVLCIKLANKKEAVSSLLAEAIWMTFLESKRKGFPLRFDIPGPVKLRNGYVFELVNVPPEVIQKFGPSKGIWAMAYIAPKDYFCYPNHHHADKGLPVSAFQEVMSRNAWLFGKLASEGIVHTAPIPLFHNRVQRARRTDAGLYEWQRGGRLDRWLQSCSFPNFGPTGVRDFEHIFSFKGKSKQLYAHIGTHLLSLFLTAGSYFRNKAPGRMGFTKDGHPVDTRDLFDTASFKRLLESSFFSYFKGFTGIPFAGPSPCDFGMLTTRLIEEMGVDRHMEEVLRVADQEEMTETAFQDFLMERGYSRQEAITLVKGEKDIVIHTGPHLGGFNERISVPELIEAIGAMSALCIAGKYWQDQSAT